LINYAREKDTGSTKAGYTKQEVLTTLSSLHPLPPPLPPPLPQLLQSLFTRVIRFYRFILYRFFRFYEQGIINIIHSEVFVVQDKIYTVQMPHTSYNLVTSKEYLTITC